MLLVLDGLVGFAAVLADPKAMPKVCAVLEGGPRFGLTRAHERFPLGDKRGDDYIRVLVAEVRWARDGRLRRAFGCSMG